MRYKAAIGWVILAAATASALWLVVPSWSQTARPSSENTDSPASSVVAPLLDRSAFIVYGRIVTVSNILEQSGRSQYPFQVATIEPYHIFKGEIDSAGPLEIRAAGHQGPDAMVTVGGQVTLSEGEDVVLFLEALGTTGHRFFSPVMERRGKFTVIQHPAFGNIVLDGDELLKWKRHRTLPDEPLKLTDLQRAIEASETP